MKKILFLLIATSLTANAWLLVQDFAHVPERPRPVQSSQAVAASDGKAGDTSGAAILVQLASSDLAGLRDALRTANFDEASIRAVIDGALRRRHREQVAAARLENYRTGWWRPPGVPVGGAAPSVHARVNEPLRELLGADPFDVLDAELRYDFLPAEKRRKLALIDVDYGDLQARTPVFARGLAATKSEVDEQRMLAQERQRDVLAALSPEERAEFELRFTGTAASNARRFAEMGATEAEFRAIKPALDQLKNDLETMAVRTDLLVERTAMEQRVMDQLVSTVGYDRAVEFLWAVSGPYQDTALALHQAGLPKSHAARLSQLAAETGEKAATIHYDDSLSAEKKQASLLELQQSVRLQIDALVPLFVQAQLPNDALAWFRVLAEGRYIRTNPALPSGGRVVSGPTTVTAPPIRARQPVPLPRVTGN